MIRKLKIRALCRLVFILLPFAPKGWERDAVERDLRDAYVKACN